MSRELSPKAPAARPQRASNTVRNRLSLKNTDPNYEYRIVNDQSDRVELLKEIGYEVVSADTVRVGDKRVDLGKSVGSAATLSLGRGDNGVVMRIRKDWYVEDQKTKQLEVDKTEQTMKETARSNGNYGKIDISRG